MIDESIMPLAMGGGHLEGCNWVRFLYLDEAGVGKVEADPFLIVAGVLINADTQWMKLSSALSTILQEATPKGAKVPSCIHAKDVFHGSGEFPREIWDKPRRDKLLADVAALPAKYDVPVVWCSVDRKAYARDFPDASPYERVRDGYTVAAVACFMKAEIFMRALSNKTEVASIVLEQNHALQKRIPEIMAFIRSPGEEAKNLLPGWQDIMPFRRIADTPSAQVKTAANILQLADYCAFALKRRMQGAKDATTLTHPFAQQMLTFSPPGADDTGKDVIWNPKFMPHLFAKQVEFKDGRFVLKA